MKDLSMHILDIVENSTRAGARHVSIEVGEDTRKGIMTITITDDGRGMTDEEVQRALDPFYTKKTERNVGLGLPMFKRTAEQCGGSLGIQSKPCVGTRVQATFMLNHIDLPPMGDLNETLCVMMAGNPDVEFDVKYTVDGIEECFSSREDSAGSKKPPAIAPGS